MNQAVILDGRHDAVEVADRPLGAPALAAIALLLLGSMAGAAGAFWANRLIAANRRAPHQIFSLLAELTRARPNPGPYFASQLIDYLYDEEAALAPVQRWLERTFQKSLNDLSLQEKSRPPFPGNKPVAPSVKRSVRMDSLFAS